MDTTTKKQTLSQFKKRCNEIASLVKTTGGFKKCEVMFVHARLFRSTSYIDAAAIVCNNTKRFWIIRCIRTGYTAYLCTTIRLVNESLFGRRAQFCGLCSDSDCDIQVMADWIVSTFKRDSYRKCKTSLQRDIDEYKSNLLDMKNERVVVE